MHRLSTLLFLVGLSSWVRGDDAYLSAYEKACDASALPFGKRPGSEEKEAVFRTLRERRSSDDDDCDCGPGTILCIAHSGRKFCRCRNDALVINLPCAACPCPHGVCHGTSECYCQGGFGLIAENTCQKCDCGDSMPCKFSEGIKLCLCYDNFISVSRRCTGCNCGSLEMCFDKQVVKRCTCSSRAGSLPECNNVLSQGECDCTVEDSCTYNATEVRCKCLPHYVKLNGTCTECTCDDENAICNFQNGTKVCSCKNRFVEHNGTCVECFCGEGHSCELKNGSTECICQEGHIEHEGICKECICGEGEDCELVDGKKLCLCKENYLRVDGVCKECFCGEGHGCDYFAGIGKLCTCRKYFAEINETCKECHCGGGHDCKFLENGNKNCLCSPGFSVKNGTCTECFCGNNSLCAFEGEDKVCLCNHGSIVKNGMCHEICRNDTCDRGTCEIEDDTFKCSCDIGFGGDRCDQKLAVSKEASYVIYTLTAITLFWIILVAVYFVRRKRKRDPIYHKVSVGDNPDDGVFMSTVASSSDRK